MLLVILTYAVPCGSETTAGMYVCLDAVAVASYSFKGYVAERQGEREEMQDAHVVLDTFLSPDTESQLW